MSDRPLRPPQPNKRRPAPSFERPPGGASAFKTQGYESFVTPQARPHDPARPAAPKISLEGFTPPPQPHTPQPHSPQSLPALHAQEGFEEGQSTLILQGEDEAPTALKRALLKVISGEQKGEEFVLNRALTRVGRALDNDIVLIDIAASRKHMTFERHEGGFRLRDLQSANGVALNGVRVFDEELYDGDVVEVGETQLAFESLGERRERPFEEEVDTDPGVSYTPHAAQPAGVGAHPTVARQQVAQQAAQPHPPAPQHTSQGMGARWSAHTAPVGVSPNAPARPATPPATPPQTPAPLPRVPAPFETSSHQAMPELGGALGAPPPRPSKSMLPFSPPQWGDEQSEAVVRLEPIPELPPEPSPPSPAPPPRYPTMGLSGLTPEELAVGAPPSPFAQWRARLSERLWGLWDELLLRTSLDRFSPLTLALIGLALVTSLLLGRYVGMITAFDPVRFEARLTAELERGALSEARVSLEEAKGSLSEVRFKHLDELVSQAERRLAHLTALQTALQAQRGEEALNHATQLAPTDTALTPFTPQLTQVRRQLAVTALQNARQSLWRGVLKEVEPELERASAQLNTSHFPLQDPSLQQQLIRLRYALLLHQERLDDARGLLSPSPTEQRHLARAAQLVMEGNPREALKLLRRERPSSGARRALFELRAKALSMGRKEQRLYKRAKRAQRYSVWLPYEERAHLLAEELNLDEVATRYIDALKHSVQSARYQEAARWLRAVEVLKPQDATLKALRQRLESNAQSWRRLGMEALKRGERSEASALLKAAALFLPEEERVSIEQALKASP